MKVEGNFYTNPLKNQNFCGPKHKNKEAAAALVDIKHYMKLLKLEEMFEQSIDNCMHNVALERKDDVADISLGKVLNDEDIDYDDVLNNFEDIDLEE